jgi:hypothetical protein
VPPGRRSAACSSPAPPAARRSRRRAVPSGPRWAPESPKVSTVLSCRGVGSGQSRDSAHLVHPRGWSGCVGGGHRRKEVVPVPAVAWALIRPADGGRGGRARRGAHSSRAPFTASPEGNTLGDPTGGNRVRTKRLSSRHVPLNALSGVRLPGSGLRSVRGDSSCAQRFSDWSGGRRDIDRPPEPSAQRGPGPAHRRPRCEPQVPGPPDSTSSPGMPGWRPTTRIPPWRIGADAA